MIWLEQQIRNQSERAVLVSSSDQGERIAPYAVERTMPRRILKAAGNIAMTAGFVATGVVMGATVGLGVGLAGEAIVDVVSANAYSPADGTWGEATVMPLEGLAIAGAITGLAMSARLAFQDAAHADNATAQR